MNNKLALWQTALVWLIVAFALPTMAVQWYHSRRVLAYVQGICRRNPGMTYYEAGFLAAPEFVRRLGRDQVMRSMKYRLSRGQVTAFDKGMAKWLLENADHEF